MAVSANRLELLQIADAVAREKSIDRSIVITAMEDAIAKAARSRYGAETERLIVAQSSTVIPASSTRSTMTCSVAPRCAEAETRTSRYPIASSEGSMIREMASGSIDNAHRK